MDIQNSPFSLNGKTILVTGASSGIGQAVAIQCARMGAKLIINGRNEDRLKETLSHLDGYGHSYIAADLSDETQLEALVNELTSISGVCLCAGIGSTSPVSFASRKKFDNIFNVNFFAQTELSRLLLKKKILTRNSSLVFMASIGGIMIFSPGNAIYGSAKAALYSWCRFIAKEQGIKGIRANCICPGMVETPLIHKGTITSEQLEEDRKKYPLQRYGQPEDIANAAVYLLSDASSWVTGTSITIDGGISI